MTKIVENKMTKTEETQHLTRMLNATTIKDRNRLKTIIKRLKEIGK